MTLSGGGLVEAAGFRASSPSLAAAFGSLFLHWNVFHLLGNMLFVAVAGAAVELALGWWRYLIVYLLGGLTGVLVHWAAYRSATDNGVLAGASACVAACVGFAAIRYARQRVPISPKVHVPVLAVAGTWIILQILGTFVRLGDSSGGTGFAAHLGGLAFGLSMAFVFGASGNAELDAAYSRLSQATGPDAALVTAKAILERRPNDQIALAQAANALQTLGDRRQEVVFRLRQLQVDSEQALPRLIALGALGQVPALDRMKLACSSELRTQVLKSVAIEDCVERPDAMLELITLEPNGGWRESLARDFPLHPAADIARARGLF